MPEQLLEAYHWLAAQPIDWGSVLVVSHYVGLALALSAALAGDGLGLVVLFFGGEKPSRRALGRIHRAVVFGLCLIWVSGLVLISQKFSLGQLPGKIIFKLAVATLLSLNSLMIRDVLIPLSQRVRRPIAPRLSINRAFAVSMIGSISIASWVSLAAVGFMTSLQALPLQTLFATYIGFVAGLTTLGLVLIGAMRLLITPSDGGPKRRKKNRQQPERGPRPPAIPAPAAYAPAAAAPRLVVSDQPNAHDRLTQRLRQSLAAQRSNDNSEGHVRERLERERLRRSQQADPVSVASLAERLRPPGGPPREPGTRRRRRSVRDAEADRSSQQGEVRLITLLSSRQ